MIPDSVYLSGVIGGLDYDTANMWRGYVKSQLDPLGIRCLSPLRGKEYLRGAGVLTCMPYDEHPLSSAAGILARDRWDTTNSSLVFCNLLGAKRVSIGSMVELGWADLARVPVIMVMEKTGNLHEHLFMGLVSYRVEDIDSGIDIIRAFLGR